MNGEWKPQFENNKEMLHLLRGIDSVISDIYPNLTLYLTMNGWIRKETYK